MTTTTTKSGVALESTTFAFGKEQQQETQSKLMFQNKAQKFEILSVCVHSALAHRQRLCFSFSGRFCFCVCFCQRKGKDHSKAKRIKKRNPRQARLCFCFLPTFCCCFEATRKAEGSCDGVVDVVRKKRKACFLSLYFFLHSRLAGFVRQKMCNKTRQSKQRTSEYPEQPRHLWPSNEDVPSKNSFPRVPSVVHTKQISLEVRRGPNKTDIFSPILVHRGPGPA